MDKSVAKSIPYLDGWRGLAIIFVLLCHFGPTTFRWLGLFGVLLFFVLSGFLMSQLLFIKKVDLPTFFVRRFSRVIPTFLLFSITMVIYSANFQPVSYSVTPSELISTLLFLRTYFPATISIWADNWPIGHIWSLNVEEHSYIYLALVALVFRSTAKNFLPFFLVGTVLVVLCLNIYTIKHPPVDNNWWIATQYVCLALITSATYQVIRSQKKLKWLSKIPSIIPILSFVLAAICGLLYYYRGLHITAAPLLLAFTLNHLDDIPAFCKKMLSFPLLRWFGTCSFSIYLWQQPFYHLVKFNHASALLNACLAIGTGVLSFYLFENPLRQYLNNAWRCRTNQVMPEQQQPDLALIPSPIPPDQQH